MRVNLSVAIVYMASDFDWDEKTNGVILGMFFYGYVLTQVPGGRMAELVGGKWLFGVGEEVTDNNVIYILTDLTPDVRGPGHRGVHPGHPRGGPHQPHPPLRGQGHRGPGRGRHLPRDAGHDSQVVRSGGEEQVACRHVTRTQKMTL